MRSLIESPWRQEVSNTFGEASEARHSRETRLLRRLVPLEEVSRRMTASEDAPSRSRLWIARVMTTVMAWLVAFFVVLTLRLAVIVRGV